MNNFLFCYYLAQESKVLKASIKLIYNILLAYVNFTVYIYYSKLN